MAKWTEERKAAHSVAIQVAIGRGVQFGKKGVKHIVSDEVRLKLSIALKAAHANGRRKQLPKWTDEQKMKLSEVRKKQFKDGKIKPPNHTGIKRSKEHVEAIIKAHKGVIRSDETKAKQSALKKGVKHGRGYCGPRCIGEKHPNWKGGTSKTDRKKFTESIPYKEWRKSVFERDNYTCLICNKKGGELNVDHIKSYSNYPELRMELDNGRTLCVSCHRKTDNFGGRVNKQNNL